MKKKIKLRFNNKKSPIENFLLFEKFIKIIDPTYGNILVKNLKQSLNSNNTWDFRSSIKNDVTSSIQQKIGTKNGQI